MSSQINIDIAEGLLVSADSEYFNKYNSLKIRTAITQALRLLPLPCRGGDITLELCNLNDDLIRIGKGEDPLALPKEITKDLVTRVKKVLEN